MAEQSARRLRSRLRGFGLSNAAIDAAWPRWWSDEAESSLSAQTELVFGVARRLGLDPRSLLEDGDQPRFMWWEEARFKHLSGENEIERAGITSFGRAVASILIKASPEPTMTIAGVRASDLRRHILASGSPFVGLLELLSLAWSVGVPVVHLRVFPWRQKRMAAMTASLGDRWAVLLGKDSQYPAPIAFYVAHELGHIALGQVATNRQIIDLEDVSPSLAASDEEDMAADEFALELLTGDPDVRVLPADPRRSSAPELARVAEAVGAQLRIEPGVLAQCYGYSTNNWQTATAALRYIYRAPSEVWVEVNGIARRELNLRDVSDDAAGFLESVLGQPVA